jgi:subtilisin-like proprotein convertase family protein
MSECGGAFAVSHVTLTFTDGATSTLPDASQITSGAYRSINYGGPDDALPPNAAQAYSASLATFNNTSPAGNWSLYVVDDESGDTGSIAGGWTLEIDTTNFRNSTGIIFPGSLSTGPANPYPSQIAVAGLSSTIRNVRVSLFGITHTFPDDVDILLVGPNGQNALIMSDVGGGQPVTNVSLVFDDAAADSLPDQTQITSGTFKPTDVEAGDTFAAPAPNPAGTTALSTFAGTTPNGDWNLFAVDDGLADTGSINLWTLDFDFAPTILANISTRLPVLTGDNVLIGGFIVTGTQPKKVILRAIGPSLNLPGQLTDTTMELRDGGGGLIWFNDDWRDGSGFPSQEAEIIASTIPPSNDLESAIVATLPANNANYTIIVRGLQNRTGIALVEAYDLDQTVDSKLANISTRGFVQTGEDVLIAGTILLGTTSQKLVLRALGPSLSVPGAMADPTLELRDAMGTLLMANNDWKDAQEADVFLTTIPPSNTLESAMVVTLPSGGAFYTAIVRGLNGGTGVAVVEVYGLN